MTHQVLQNRSRCSLNIHIPPVDPTMRRPQCRTQQPIPSLCHRFSPTRLRSEAVPTLNILIHFLSEVLAKDGNLAKLLLRYLVLLQVIQELSQQLISVILGVTDQESQVDEVVWIC